MILDTIVALFRMMSNSDMFDVKIERIEAIIKTFYENKDRLIRNNNILLLDFDITSIRNKDYVTKISIDGNVSFNLSESLANRILNVNHNLILPVYNALRIASYNYKLSNTFNYPCGIIYDNPNNSYKLHYTNIGFDKTENKLYTDGELELIEVEPRIVEINNASYAINVLETNKVFNLATIYTLRLDTEFFKFLLEELKTLPVYEGGYKIVGKEPRTYIKLRN